MEHRKRFKTILLTLVLIGVLTGTGLGVSQAVKHSNAAVSPEPAISQPIMIPATFSDLAEKIRPGVVNIQVVKKVKNIGLSERNFQGFPFGEKDPFGDFFGPFSQGKPTKRLRTAGHWFGVCHQP